MAKHRTTTRGKTPRVIGSERAWDTMRIESAIKTLEKASQQIQQLQTSIDKALERLARARPQIKR